MISIFSYLFNQMILLTTSCALKFDKGDMLSTEGVQFNRINDGNSTPRRQPIITMWRSYQQRLLAYAFWYAIYNSLIDFVLIDFDYSTMIIEMILSYLGVVHKGRLQMGEFLYILRDLTVLFR